MRTPFAAPKNEFLRAADQTVNFFLMVIDHVMAPFFNNFVFLLILTMRPAALFDLNNPKRAVLKSKRQWKRMKEENNKLLREFKANWEARLDNFEKRITSIID